MNDVKSDKNALIKKRWTIASFFFISGIITASWSSRIPDVQQKFQLNDADWGTVLVALPCGLVAGLFIAPWLVARFGTQKTMLSCGILASILLCLLGIAHPAAALRVVLFFVGFVRTIWGISMNTGAVELQKEYGRPIVSAFHGLWSLACLMAAVIGTGMIVLMVLPSQHFALISFSCLVLLMLLWFRNKEKIRISQEKKPFLVRPDKYLWLLGAIAFCVMTAESTMFDWSVNYFEQVVHVQKGWTTLGYSCFIIAMALGRLIGDPILHRFGMLNILMLNGGLMAAGFFTASFFPSLYPAALGFLLIGLGDSIIVPTLYSLAAQSARMQSGYALTSVTLIGYVGFLSAPLLVGSISHRWNMPIAFALVGLLTLFIPVLARTVKKSSS